MIRSRSLNANNTQRRRARNQRHLPVTLKQLQNNEEYATRNEKSIENPVFTISNLRKPYHMLDPTTRKQLDKTCEKHKKIDDKFLDERIRPRVIIFMEDGTNLVQNRPGKHEVPIF